VERQQVAQRVHGRVDLRAPLALGAVVARALGADKDEGALDRVFGKVVPPVLPKPTGKPDETQPGSAKRND
jgi:hypothetical protein